MVTKWPWFPVRSSASMPVWRARSAAAGRPARSSTSPSSPRTERELQAELLGERRRGRNQFAGRRRSAHASPRAGRRRASASPRERRDRPSTRSRICSLRSRASGTGVGPCRAASTTYDRQSGFPACDRRRRARAVRPVRDPRSPRRLAGPEPELAVEAERRAPVPASSPSSSNTTAGSASSLLIRS